MLHILLVEDNPADAEMLRMALQRTGEALDVVLQEDGALALQYLRSKGRASCDIVLLDLNLPRLNGFEVLQNIRSSEDLRTLPVVVLSGSSDAIDVDRCYQLGANSYLCKPTHLTEILTMADRLVAYWSHCLRPSPNHLFAAPSEN